MNAVVDVLIIVAFFGIPLAAFLYLLLQKMLGRPRDGREPATHPQMADEPGNLAYDVVQIPVSDLESAFNGLREQGRAEGFTPVILSDPDAATWVSGGRPPVEEILREAAQIDVPAWLAAEAARPTDVERGDWPTDVEHNRGIGMSLRMDLQGRTDTQATVVKVPTAISWEVPAYLEFGGWNACPSAAHQVAIARYWHERYGGDIACVGSDTIEYTVSAPPSDRRGAEDLAWEQYWFCPDIVEQGTFTICRLAAGLLNTNSWFFWWD